MQRITSCFAEAAQLVGLEVSLKKTEVLHQPAPQEKYHPPSIFIEQSELKAVHQFSYIGYIITSDAKIDKEVDNGEGNKKSNERHENQCLQSCCADHAPVWR